MNVRMFSLIFLLSVIASVVIISGYAQDRQMGGVGITVFVDRNFRGRSATFREDVPNLQPLGLNDRISSIRVGRGEQWEVCEHANYQGRCVVVSGDLPDLRNNRWNDIISSFRRVSGGGLPRPPSQGDSIIIFDRTNFSGRSRSFTGPQARLSGTAQSVTIGRGAWELCDRQNFGGRCIRVEQNVTDLATLGFRNRVFSARPAAPGGPIGSIPSDWYIVVFEDFTFRGNPTNYYREEPNLNKRARSVTVGKGVWEICEGRNFTGHCVTLDQSVADLRTVNFAGGRVSSLRPLLRQPR